MTIASEIQRIKTNIANAYTACDGKGATMPETQNSANLATTINSIPSGTTPTGTLSITANGVYDVTNYASANVSVSGGGSSNLTNLYCWLITESGFLRDKAVFTASPTPNIGDNAIIIISNGVTPTSVTGVTSSSEINTEHGGKCSRYATRDILFN